MSTLEHEFPLRLDRAIATDALTQSGIHGGAPYGPALKYSSPLPWALALVTSGAMWAGIGWILWQLP